MDVHLFSSVSTPWLEIVKLLMFLTLWIVSRLEEAVQCDHMHVSRKRLVPEALLRCRVSPGGRNHMPGVQGGG